MFFTRYFAKKRLNQLRSITQQLSSFTPARQLCEAIVDEISPELFVKYDPNKASTVMLYSAYPNLEEYTTALKKLVRELTDENHAVDGSVWGAPLRLCVTVDDLFKTKDGFYSNAQETVTEFKSAATQFCTIMEDSDTVEFGIPSHNLRMLTQLFSNLREVAITLIHVSLI